MCNRFSTQWSIANNVIHLNECSASLNNTDYVNATGTLDLQRPQHYSGKMSASVLNLATLEPLLRAFGNQNHLAGSLRLDWEGSGNAQTFKNSGKLKLASGQKRATEICKALQANVDASYSPEGLDVPIIFFATTNMDFQAIARTKGDTLEIDKIQLNQVASPPSRAPSRSGATEKRALPPAQTKYAYGYVSIPFIWRNLGTQCRSHSIVWQCVCDVQSENLDLKRLFDDLGIKATTSGVANARLDASGTIADLNTRLDVQVRDMRSEYWPKMEPATFELTRRPRRIG